MEVGNNLILISWNLKRGREKGDKGKEKKKYGEKEKAENVRQA